MKYKVRAATIIDVIDAAYKLRKADLDEMMALGFTNPIQALAQSLDVSEISLVDTIDGRVGCFFGVLPDGCVWCVTTEEYIENHKKRFMQLSHEVIDSWQESYETLWNHVYCENKVHIRWIKHMGFVLQEPKPYGLKDKLFMKFTRN